MTIVPAALALLGHRAWSLSAWIDRILPVVDIEGAKLSQLSDVPLRQKGLAVTEFSKQP
ncbi:hypothetical protein ACF1HJ_33840 [Streptomyces sp. NPDC013978]|uniref:hypothetical protein n=1 Tax=Streptomyces sp. NPDC013978 TaxID=3364869 RepID=UPI003700BD61